MGLSVQQERRRSERRRLDAMYTSVEASPSGDAQTPEPLHGHAYDISESGVRIELDEALAVGQTVELKLNLPGLCGIGAIGKVVWVNDEHDDPAARRMAVQFTQFAGADDHKRLRQFVATSAYRCAA